MNSINTTPSHRPKCPNHGVPLDGCGFPLPKKGVGICPVSGAPFEFEVDVQEGQTEYVKDKFGRLVPKPADWRVSGSES